MDNAASLDVLHRLFESLAPIVFRPVDILLKTLLQTPDNLVSENVDFYYIKGDYHCTHTSCIHKVLWP